MGKVDYLLVGQGIAGTLLSYFLLKEGKNIQVIDHYNEHIPSLAAGAIINPVTGRKTLTTWKIDELLPFAKQTYRELEHLLGISILTEMPIHKYFSNPADRDAIDENKMISLEGRASLLIDPDPNIIHQYGGIIIHDACRIDGTALLPAWRKYLLGKGFLVEGKFNYEDLVLTNDKAVYHDVEATRVIFCEGARVQNNPWFSQLPLNPAKGEALIIEMDGLSQQHIILKGIYLLPIGGNRFYVGSTNEWDHTDDLPTETKRQELEADIVKITSLPYKLISHLSGTRPGVKNRRPLIGVHTQHPQLCLFNGMGTKGFSLSPWCAQMFIDHLERGKPLDKETDIRRFVF